MYLELSNEKHHKFYEITLDTAIVTVTYGRIGRPGRSNQIRFDSTQEALKFFERQVQHKIRKGYKEALKGGTEPRTGGTHPRQLRLPFFCFMG
jgi:predicted DNA-binding WGR domain protein